MVGLKVFLALIVAVAFVEGSLKEDKEFCPDTSKAIGANLIVSKEIDKSGEFFGRKVVERIPTTGFLEKTIGCIVITDKKEGKNSGNAKIIAGGLLQNYVEIELTAAPLQKLDYVIDVFSA